MLSKWAGRGGVRPAPPAAIVLHSGSRSAGVAEWFRSRWNKRRAWTTLAWSSRLNRLVQCDSLDQRTWHVGRWWNDWAIGIEYPGPWRLSPRPQHQHDEVRAAIDGLTQIYPSLRILTTHQALTRTKRDPGPGVTPEHMGGLGLEVRF